MLSYCTFRPIRASGIAAVTSAYRFLDDLLHNLGDRGYGGRRSFPARLPRRTGPATRHDAKQCVRRFCGSGKGRGHPHHRAAGRGLFPVRENHGQRRPEKAGRQSGETRADQARHRQGLSHQRPAGGRQERITASGCWSLRPTILPRWSQSRSQSRRRSIRIASCARRSQRYRCVPRYRRLRNSASCRLQSPTSPASTSMVSFAAGCSS